MLDIFAERVFVANGATESVIGLRGLEPTKLEMAEVPAEWVRNHWFDFECTLEILRARARHEGTYSPRSRPALSQTDTFYRLYGDNSGDKRVNATDPAQFNNRLECETRRRA